MATLTPVSFTSLQPTALASFTFDAISSTGDKYAMGRRNVLLVKNTNTSSARTVTITGAADSIGRVKTITAESVAALGIKRYTLEDKGWADAAGNLNLSGSSTDLVAKLFRVDN